MTMSFELTPFVVINLSSLFFWTVTFFVESRVVRLHMSKLFQSKNPDKKENQIKSMTNKLSTRITSIIHNLIQIPFALWLLGKGELNSDPLYAYTKASVVCISISAGYFLFDLTICCRDFQTEGPLFLFHAICCLTLYSYGSFTKFLHYYGLAFLLWEVSTPFVHFRWLLKKLKMEHGSLYFINGVLMLSTFFLFRCIWGLYLSISFWNTSSVELVDHKVNGIPASILWLYRVSNICLNCLNSFWMMKMTRMAFAFLNTSQTKQH